jgi:hypothetical protein
VKYRFAAVLALTIPLAAQPLRVYSELARLDAVGEVTSPENPREILSPAIARNAFTSFQVVVRVPKGTHYGLYVGQNPEDAARITLYRENGDRLESVEFPYEGDATQVFWMDVWADRNAPVRRIKIEPQLWIDGDWVTYPMEARVMDATVPEGRWPEGAASPAEVIRGLVCGTKPESPAAQTLTLARLRFRNAQQDLALAMRAPREPLQKLAGACETQPPADPEWYLRIRDYLFRLR